MTHQEQQEVMTGHRVCVVMRKLILELFHHAGDLVPSHSNVVRALTFLHLYKNSNMLCSTVNASIVRGK